MFNKWTVFNAPTAPTSLKDKFSGPFQPDIMILLTDGSVLVHNTGALDENDVSPAREWRRLTPDLTLPDPYGQGKWSDTILMVNVRQYFASGVLMDGRVFAIGGEDSVDPNPPHSTIHDIPLGEIFDPRTNKWSVIDKPKDFDFINGDAPSCMLSDGRILIGGATDSQPPNRRTALWSPLDPSLNPNGEEWMEAGLDASGQSTKSDQCAEESWALLPDGSVLATAVFNNPQAERYVPSLDRWFLTATPPSLAFDMLQGLDVNEIGPTILLPSGVAFAVGATGTTGLFAYDHNHPKGPGKWKQGPSFPPNLQSTPINWPTLTACDAPACLLPSGKVVCVGGTPEPGPNSDYAVFLEYDPNSSATVIAPLDQQPPLSNPATLTCRLWMLILPTGQLLCSQSDVPVLLYSPARDERLAHPAWKPKITSLPATMQGGQSYQIMGTQFNGLSQAAGYGDDGQMATNYPIVMITNDANGASRYLHSYNFSTMAVATGNTVVSCTIDLPKGLPTGTWDLSVITNGIPSISKQFQLQ